MGSVRYRLTDDGLEHSEGNVGIARVNASFRSHREEIFPIAGTHAKNIIISFIIPRNSGTSLLEDLLEHGRGRFYRLDWLRGLSELLNGPPKPLVRWIPGVRGLDIAGVSPAVSRLVHSGCSRFTATTTESKDEHLGQDDGCERDRERVFVPLDGLWQRETPSARY